MEKGKRIVSTAAATRATQHREGDMNTSDPDALAQEMRDLVPAKVIDSNGTRVMDQILAEGVAVQEDMIQALAQKGEYILESYRRTEGDEDRREKEAHSIFEQVDELVRYWRSVGIGCDILTGPHFVRSSKGNDMYDVFYTKVIRT